MISGNNASRDVQLIQHVACQAILIAREAGREQSFYLAIQQADSLHAKNPSDNDLLVELAVSVGLDGSLFKEKLHSTALNEQLLAEIAQTT